MIGFPMSMEMPLSQDFEVIVIGKSLGYCSLLFDMLFNNWQFLNLFLIIIVSHIKADVIFTRNQSLKRTYAEV